MCPLVQLKTAWCQLRVEINSDLNDLLHKHIKGSLSDEEKLQVLQFLRKGENLQVWNELLSKLYEDHQGDTIAHKEEDVERMIQFVLDYSTQKSPEVPLLLNPLKKTRWFSYAAAVLIFACIGAYLFYDTGEKKIVQRERKATLQSDLLPGSQKAILTLSNGKIIALDSNDQQTITDGKVVIRNRNGTLTYGHSEVVVYNTMSTPKGGQYRLNLSDGTNVWLNAASSISFPTSFPSHTRIVNITGEAYFEVSKNPGKPFIVKTYKDEITVLGTSFNVNSYPGESNVKTSLLEGSVYIDTVILKPGEAYSSGRISSTDLDQDVAWKIGVFNFHHVKLADAMRQIARWYDVDVRYEGKFNNTELGGEIGRNLTLQQLLSGLEDKELQFDLKGKMLTVIQQ